MTTSRKLWLCLSMLVAVTAPLVLAIVLRMGSIEANVGQLSEAVLQDVRASRALAVALLVAGVLIASITGWVLSRALREADKAVREDRAGALASAARKAAIIQASLDCIIEVDQESCIVEFNPAAERTFGYRREHVVGRQMADLIIPPHLRERHRQGMARYLATGEGPILGQRIEISAMRADGIEFPVELTVLRVPVEGPPMFAAVLRDLTAQRQAESHLRESDRRLRFVLDAMPQKIFTATANGNVDYFNPVWSQFTGLTFDEIRDWGWTQFIHPDDLEENVRVWRHAIETGEPFQFEHRFRRADGEYRWHLSRAVPMRDGAGAVAMWIGSNTDIDEQRRAGERMRQHAEEMAEVDRRKNEFLAMLAHELRNPLAPIRNGLHLMRLKKDDADAVGTVSAMMERQVVHLVRLVEDLLDVSRISQGKIELRRERVDLAAIANEALEAARAMPPCAERELLLELPPDPVWLDADATRLAQILGNLLNNACKFSREGGRILLAVEHGGGEATIRVKDDGIGIAPDHLERVFEMFVQADSSLGRATGGLGIGLTLVKSLVELHGGTVRARSEGLGRGAEIVVRLPTRGTE